MASAKTWVTYSAGQQTQKIVGTGLYLYPILFKYYKHLSYLLFDFNVQGTKSLKNKFLPIEGTVTEDGKTLSWYDYSMFDKELTIDGNNDTATSITVAEVTGLATLGTAGIEAGDQLLIVRAAGSAKNNVKVTVTAVVDDTSITWAGAIDLDIGDKVVRAFYVQEIGVAISRGQSSYDYTEFKSYFQNFARSVTFAKIDLNKQYLIEKDAKEYIASIFALNMNILLQEFNKAIWIGANVTGSKPEMLWMDTAIEQLVLSDPSLKIDFSTTAGVRAAGRIVLTVGTTADTWTATLDWTAASAITFDTSLAVTAIAMAADITANVPRFNAVASGTTVFITAINSGTTDNGAITVAVTGTAAATDTELTWGLDGTVATDDEKVEKFMDAIEKASASGAIQSGETLTMPCNRKFLSALGRVKKEDIVYNEKVKEIDFTIFKFTNMFGQVEFYHEPMLDTMSQKSLAYIIPRSLISCKFRKNQNLTDEKGGMEAAKGEITVRKQINNLYDSAIFDMYFEAAVVMGWLTSGAYLKLENL